MTICVEANQYIEGLSIKGQSRQPLINRGLKPYRNLRVHQFIGRQDVKAGIERILEDQENKIVQGSKCESDANVLCEKALILSKSCKHSHSVGPGSSTHQTNHWKFPQQTAVRVDHPHPEIQQAIDKRKEQALIKD